MSDWFAVASFYEARELRDQGITTPILVFGFLDDSNIEEAAQKNITCSALSYSYALHIAEPVSYTHLCEIAHQTASLYGGSAQVEFRDFAAPLINDNQVVEELTPVAQAVVGKDRVIHNQEKMMQADDFADYLAHVPGCYAFIGSRNSQSCHTGMPHHHARCV